MPKLTVQDKGTFEVRDGQRLVLAIAEQGIDILHRCGGKARCTTCRVEFIEGEPAQMTAAERNKLQDQQNLGAFRLSCQLLCDRDMTVKVLMTRTSNQLDDSGPTPAEQITPEPEWT
jgi:ferredoxin